MADDSVVDDDESQIVTKFLLNTCRLLQPTTYHALAVALSIKIMTEPGRLPDDEEVDCIPLTTGSIAEFYIQPMLSCIGDIDIMRHLSDHLAIPVGHPLPSQLPAKFHSRVEVFEIISSEHPGYVYLLRSYLLVENTDAYTYDVVQFDKRQYLYYYHIYIRYMTTILN